MPCDAKERQIEKRQQNTEELKSLGRLYAAPFLLYERFKNEQKKESKRKNEKT